MKSSFFAFDHVHLLGESATHPRALRLPHHTALLRLAGSSPLRCRALSGAPIAVSSGASNCRFKDDPPGPESGSVRVRRDGSWHSWSLYARCFYRNWNSPQTRYTLVGMRLLREVDDAGH